MSDLFYYKTLSVIDMVKIPVYMPNPKSWGKRRGPKFNPLNREGFFPNTFDQSNMFGDSFYKNSCVVPGLQLRYKYEVSWNNNGDYPNYILSGSIAYDGVDENNNELPTKYIVVLTFDINLGDSQDYPIIRANFRCLSKLCGPKAGPLPQPKGVYTESWKEIERNGKSGSYIIKKFEEYLERYLKVVEGYFDERCPEDFSKFMYEVGE